MPHKVNIIRSKKFKVVNKFNINNVINDNSQIKINVSKEDTINNALRYFNKNNSLIHNNNDKEIFSK